MCQKSIRQTGLFHNFMIIIESVYVYCLRAVIADIPSLDQLFVQMKIGNHQIKFTLLGNFFIKKNLEEFY